MADEMKSAIDDAVSCASGLALRFRLGDGDAVADSVAHGCTAIRRYQCREPMDLVLVRRALGELGHSVNALGRREGLEHGPRTFDEAMSKIGRAHLEVSDRMSSPSPRVVPVMMDTAAEERLARSIAEDFRPTRDAALKLLAVVKAALPVLAPQKTDPKRGERALTELQSAANALHNALNGENS